MENKLWQKNLASEWPLPVQSQVQKSIPGVSPRESYRGNKQTKNSQPLGFDPRVCVYVCVHVAVGLLFLIYRKRDQNLIFKLQQR